MIRKGQFMVEHFFKLLVMCQKKRIEKEEKIGMAETLS